MGLLGFTDSAPTEGSPMDSTAQDFAMSPSAAEYVDPFQGMPAAAAPMDTGASGKMIPEMNALREWEDKHEQTLEETARQEAKDKETKRQDASSQLQKFYADRQETIQEKMGSNRMEE